MQASDVCQSCSQSNVQGISECIRWELKTASAWSISLHPTYRVPQHRGSYANSRSSSPTIQPKSFCTRSIAVLATSDTRRRYSLEVLATYVWTFLSVLAMSVDSLRTMCPTVALITRIPLIRNFSACCLTFFCSRTFPSPTKLSLYRPWQTPRASEVWGSQHRQSCLSKCVCCSHYYSFPGRLWRAIICITSGDIFSMTLSLEKYCERVTFLSKIIFHAHWPHALCETMHVWATRSRSSADKTQHFRLGFVGS